MFVIPVLREAPTSEIHTAGRYHEHWRERTKRTGEGEMSGRDKAVKEFLSV